MKDQTKYYHAHRIVPEKCNGNMACMRICPTQAIRIKKGKAAVSEELCVDCGSCISVCPSKAIVPITDPLIKISDFKYKVVVPGPALYSQFDSSIHPYIIHLALKKLGFDEVIDLNTSTAVLAKVLLKYMQEHHDKAPLISSHCPSVIRLIQVKYPDLVGSIVPLEVPREVTAREIRKNYPKKLGIKSEDIGIIYIAPCPAKMVSIKQPAEKEKSWYDGTLSINEIYSFLFPHVVALNKDFDHKDVPKDFSFNAGWATLGNMAPGNNMEKWLAVSGLDHVKRIFNDIENSKLRNVDFVEAHVCMLGCIGGPYTIENAYIARTNSIQQQIKYEKVIEVNDDEIEEKFKEGYYFLEKPILPRPTKYFDSDLETSIKRMREIKRVYQKLRKIDCGCCGAPTCMAFAEDFVRGKLELTDCIFFKEKGISEERK